MAVDWRLGAPSVDVGQQFREGYDRGREQSRQNALTSALRGLATNPNDPEAMNSLIQADPAQAMQFRAQQQQQAAQAQEQQQAEAQRRLQQIIPLARQARSMPYEQRRAFLQSIVPQLQQIGVDPGLVQGFDPTDQALEAYLAYAPQQPGQQPTSFQRDYEFIRQRDPNLAETYFRNQAEGSPVVFDVNGDGAPDLVPRSYFNRGNQSQQQGGGDLEAQAREAIRQGADPAAVRQRLEQLRQGGPSQSGSGNFP